MLLLDHRPTYSFPVREAPPGSGTVWLLGFSGAGMKFLPWTGGHLIALSRPAKLAHRLEMYRTGMAEASVVARHQPLRPGDGRLGSHGASGPVA
jgi:hypothetical protein